MGKYTSDPKPTRKSHPERTFSLIVEREPTDEEWQAMIEDALPLLATILEEMIYGMDADGTRPIRTRTDRVRDADAA